MTPQGILQVNADLHGMEPGDLFSEFRRSVSRSFFEKCLRHLRNVNICNLDVMLHQPSFCASLLFPLTPERTLTENPVQNDDLDGNDGLNGEQVCEGHDLSEDGCHALGCCQWDASDGQCWSDVGRDPCHAHAGNVSPTQVCIVPDSCGLE